MATEELKREMYRALADAKLWGCTTQGAEATLHAFETRLEAYLEELRQEAISSAASLEEVQKFNGILRDAYERQQSLTHAACMAERDTWADNHDMRDELVRLRREFQFEGGAREMAEAKVQRLAQDLKDMTRLRECFEMLACDYTKRYVETKEETDQLRNKLQAFEFANKSAGELLIRAQETIKRQRKFIRTLYTSRKARTRRTLAQIRADKESAPETICGASAAKQACLHLLAYPGNPRCPGCGALI